MFSVSKNGQADNIHTVDLGDYLLKQDADRAMWFIRVAQDIPCGVRTSWRPEI